VLGAAAALYAGVGLEADDLREIGAGDQAEVFVAIEGRDLTESCRGKKDGEGAEQQMQVLGVGMMGKKMSSARVWTHHRRRTESRCPRRRRRPGR